MDVNPPPASTKDEVVGDIDDLEGDEEDEEDENEEEADVYGSPVLRIMFWAQDWVADTTAALWWKRSWSTQSAQT